MIAGVGTPPAPLPGHGEPTSVLKDFEAAVDSVPSWDGKGRFMDLNRLTALLNEMKAAKGRVEVAFHNLRDETEASRNVFFSIIKLRYENEAWVRIYSRQINGLKIFSFSGRVTTAAEGSKSARD